MSVSRLVRLLAACGALLPFVRGVAAEEEIIDAPAAPIHRRLKASLGYHFSTGNYGTSDTTEIAYIPLVTKAEWDRWTLELSVPYIRVSGGSTVVSGPVGPVQTSGGDEEGLGDIVARGAYTVPSRAEWMPWIDLIGRVKFPTASRSKGLGTGEFDGGIEAELVWVLGAFVPFVSGGYRFLGSSEAVPLHDVWLASAGGMYPVLDALRAGLYLDYQEAATSTSGTRLDLVPFVSWTVDRHWSVDTYVSAGLASGSPDVGVGLALGYTL
jgi:hypothetical protein